MKFPLTFAIVLLCFPVISQLTFNSFHGPEALSLGNTFSNLKGAQAVFGNPASIDPENKWSACINVHNQFEIPELTAVQAGLMYQSKTLGSFGMSLFQLGRGAYKDQSLTFSYGRKISEKISLGIRFNLLHTQIEHYQSFSKLTFETGAVFQITEKIDLAIYIFNPFIQNFSVERVLPVRMTVGIKYAMSPQIDLLVEFEKDLYFPLCIKAAIRYRIFNNFHLAAGMYSTEKSPCLTSGIHYSILKKLKLDLAISYHQYLGISSSLGIDYYFL